MQYVDIELIILDLNVCSFKESLKSCATDQYACKSSKLCIPKSNLCDTVTQCHDRSDEMSCDCPIEDDVSHLLFYRCGINDKCLPKNIECYIKNECSSIFFDPTDDDEECK